MFVVQRAQKTAVLGQKKDVQISRSFIHYCWLNNSVMLGLGANAQNCVKITILYVLQPTLHHRQPTGSKSVKITAEFRLSTSLGCTVQQRENFDAKSFLRAKRHFMMRWASKVAAVAGGIFNVRASTCVRISMLDSSDKLQAYGMLRFLDKKPSSCQDMRPYHATMSTCFHVRWPPSAILKLIFCICTQPCHFTSQDPSSG